MKNYFTNITTSNNEVVYCKDENSWETVVNFDSLKDDTLDDTTNIQNAFNYCYENGCLLLFPYRQTYTIDSTIDIKSNVDFNGCIFNMESYDSSITLLPYMMFRIPSNIANITIKNGFFACNNSNKIGYRDIVNNVSNPNPIYSNLQGISTQSYTQSPSQQCSHIKIFDCYFNGVSLQLQNCFNVICSNLIFANCDEDILLLRATNVLLMNLNCQNAYVRSNYYHHIYAFFCDNIAIENDYIFGSGYWEDIYHCTYAGSNPIISNNISIRDFNCTVQCNKLVHLNYVRDIAILHGYCTNCNFAMIYGSQNESVWVEDVHFTMVTGNQNIVYNSNQDWTKQKTIMFKNCIFDIACSGNTPLFGNYNITLDNCIINNSGTNAMYFARDLVVGAYFHALHCTINSAYVILLQGNIGGIMLVKDCIVNNESAETTYPLFTAQGTNSNLQLLDSYVNAIRAIDISGNSFYNNVVGYYYSGGTVKSGLFTWSNVSAKE